MNKYVNNDLKRIADSLEKIDLSQLANSVEKIANHLEKTKLEKALSDEELACDEPSQSFVDFLLNEK